VLLGFSGGNGLALDVEIRRLGAVVVVVLKGKVTLGEASQSVRSTVEQLVAENCSKIVFNLSGVPFIDSAGLGALTLSYTKTKAVGGMLKLAEAQTRVKDALEMTRLTRLFTLYETEKDAIDSFQIPA
jgi:anti-sigma B factor antagonist